MKAIYRHAREQTDRFHAWQIKQQGWRLAGVMLIHLAIQLTLIAIIIYTAFRLFAGAVE